MGKPIILATGAYESRSVIASAQRCINLFPERNPPDAEVPYTHYQTAGLAVRVAAPYVAPVRGMYTASNGKLYAVIGDRVFYIDPDFVPQELGKVYPKLTPVRMRDNGIDLVIVDGTTSFYSIELASNTYSTRTDENYFGSDWVDYLDTFLIYNQPGTAGWYSTDSNSLTLDPLYYAKKTGGPDPVVAAVVNRDEIWVIGEKTTEVWTNVGAAQFPFQRLGGVFVEHGCAAKYSIAAWDKSIMFLSQDKNGRARVSMVQPYDLGDISTYAIEQELSKYKRLDDAIGFVYQQQGHVFYQLTFPSEDKTWVYDVKEKMWHQKVSLDEDGNWHRHRASCAAYAYGKNLCGDFQNGNIYSFEPTVFNDNGLPIPRIRSFPHIANGGARVTYDAFIANIEVGTYQEDAGPLAAPSEAADPLEGPWIGLRWSDTKGKTFGNWVLVPLGRLGEFYETPTWRQLGSGRDRVFELSWSTPAEVALNGAWLEASQNAT